MGRNIYKSHLYFDVILELTLLCCANLLGKRSYNKFCSFFFSYLVYKVAQVVALLLGGHSGRTGAVEVDVLPLAVPAVPDAGLLRLHGAGQAVAVDVLGEADVGDARRLIPDQVHVRVEQDGVDGLLGL